MQGLRSSRVIVRATRCIGKLPKGDNEMKIKMDRKLVAELCGVVQDGLTPSVSLLKEVKKLKGKLLEEDRKIDRKHQKDISKPRKIKGKVVGGEELVNYFASLNPTEIATIFAASLKKGKKGGK